MSKGTSKSLGQLTSLSPRRYPICHLCVPFPDSSTSPHPHPHPLTHIHTYFFTCHLRTHLSLPSSTFTSPSFSIHSSVMGKRLTAGQLLARAETNGYRRGAHRDEDVPQDRNKHKPETKKDQDAAVDRYSLSGRLALVPLLCTLTHRH